MELDRIQVVIRPRTAWESIDLGFSMVRHWWKPLYKIWFLFLLFILIITSPLLYWGEPFWLGYWWLKPLYDRVILYFFSHALFGEQPGFWQSLSSLRKTGLLMGLLSWRRFDLARSFNLPVWQLEGSRGKIASNRLKLLQKNSSDYDKATWLTIICIHFEWLLMFSFWGLLYMFIPANYNLDLFIILNNKSWVDFLSLIAYLFVIAIIEPLYVAAGFALYLNRRTHLEAWDIELAFRRIAEKLNSK